MERILRTGLRLSLFLCLVVFFIASSFCSDPDQTSPDSGIDGDADADATGPFTLTVEDGFGGGTYEVGDVVHIWADLDPREELLSTWTSDVDVDDLLEHPAEWHTTLVMPGRDVTIRAELEPSTLELERWTFAGSTDLDKEVRSYIPVEPRGVLLFSHGTGGNSSYIENAETFYLASAALRRGFGVVSFEAEEVVAGDLDGNEKLRWNPRPESGNVDFENVELLLEYLIERGDIDADTPLFAVGMSNGGAFSLSLGAIASSALGETYPRLVFNAVQSYCADGLAIAAENTLTPSAWFMCAQDTNDQVSNDSARSASETVAARGVDTIFDIHQPSPLYEARFTRVEGIDLPTSAAIAAELRAAGLLDAGGFVVELPEIIAGRVVDEPEQFPTLAALPPRVRLQASSQLKITYADHQMYSDWTERTLDFFEAHLAR